MQYYPTMLTSNLQANVAALGGGAIYAVYPPNHYLLLLLVIILHHGLYFTKLENL